MGKTFLLFDTIHRLCAQGVSRERIVYLNFEDDRLAPVEPPQLDLVVRCHRELFPTTQGVRLYLFLDEVQSTPGWERWVHRLCDTEDISIFVTGSSSRLLNRDLSTTLRGRSVTYEVFPLGFRETVTFRGLQYVPYDAASESRMRAALAEYLQWGGFPEVVLAEPARRQGYGTAIRSEYRLGLLPHRLLHLPWAGAKIPDGESLHASMLPWRVTFVTRNPVPDTGPPRGRRRRQRLKDERRSPPLNGSSSP